MRDSVGRSGRQETSWGRCQIEIGERDGEMDDDD